MADRLELTEAGDGMAEALQWAANARAASIPPSYLVGDSVEGTELGVMRAVLPPGYQSQIIDLQPYAPTPRRKTGKFAFTRHASFAEYVANHDEGGGTLLLATEEGEFTAYLNAHVQVSDGDPGWHDHIATYRPVETEAWQTWKRADGAPMSQEAFALFLDDRIGEIAEPDGATLRELAKNLQVKTNVDFQSGVNIANGQVHVKYQEQLESGAGPKGDLAIPERLTLVIHPFEGGEKYQMEARFRFRASSGKAVFMYVLGEEIRRVTREAVADIARAIREKTSIEPLYGAKV